MIISDAIKRNLRQVKSLSWTDHEILARIIRWTPADQPITRERLRASLKNALSGVDQPAVFDECLTRLRTAGILKDGPEIALELDVTRWNRDSKFYSSIGF